MGESDVIRLPLTWWDKAAKFIKEVGFPIAVAIFLLWDRMTVMQEFQKTMTEVKLLMVDLRDEVKKGRH